MTVLTIAFGLALGWAIIWSLACFGIRPFRKAIRWLACKCGHHVPSGKFVPAVGARDVERCLYCNDVVAEIKRTQGSLRRSQ
jgi:hypothetical protein